MILAFVICVFALLFVLGTLMMRTNNSEEAMSNYLLCGVFLLVSGTSGLIGFVLLVIKVASL